MNEVISSIGSKRESLTIILESSTDSSANPELKRSLLRTIRYFDLFDFPLGAEEIHRHIYKYSRPLHIKEVKGVLGEMIEDGTIEEIKNFFVIRGRSNMVETRKSRKFIAEKFWNRTKLYGRYMRAVP